MGNIIFKRGKFDNLPASAPEGMPLWCTDTEELFIGTGYGVRKINVNEIYNAATANTLRGLTSTIDELNFSSGVTGNIQTQLDNKLDKDATAQTATTLTGLNATVQELNYASGVIGNIQTQLDNKMDKNSSAASATTLTGLTVTVQELNYSSGVTSNIQNQLDNKMDKTSSVETATTLSGLNATIQELNYLSGVTSDIQSQLDSKQSAGSYLTTTGTAAKATADASGNVITSTYEKINKTINTLASSGTISLTDNSINKITSSGTITFSLPSVSNTSVFHQILVQLTMNSVVTINLGTSYFFNATTPDLSSTGTYNIVYEYDGSRWVCGAIKKGVAS